MQKKLLTAIAFLFSSMALFAQNINGKLVDEQGIAINKATLTLLKADGAIAKVAISNADGLYSFSNIKPNTYTIQATAVGFATQKTKPFSFTNDYTVENIVLKKAATKLNEVTVTAQKPMIEVKADKTVFNIENSINAVGSDALELLRKSPGVVVDKDDNLSLAGKNGVQVYIDGRPSPLAGKDLADFLKTVQSNNIESIEIITNPSSKYDAAGNAGIINIKLKKNKYVGTNGSVNAGYSIGINHHYNAGVSLNHRNKKINAFGNFNYNYNPMNNFMESKRTVWDTLFNLNSNINSINKTYTTRAGIDYTINKRSVLGFIVDASFNNNSVNNSSITPISYVPTNAGVKRLESNNNSNGYKDNYNLNANYKYTDSAGRDVNVDANYGYYNLYNNQNQPNIYYSFNGSNELYKTVYQMISPTKINLGNIKIDYEQPIKNGKISFGGKLSLVKTSNDFQRYNVNAGGYDSSRSNDFIYKENINALYSTINKKLNKYFTLQVGLRAEQTNSSGQSQGFKQKNSGGYASYDSSFDRNYIDIFPSASISFTKNPFKHQWSLSYSRRIDRPAYQDLNPFEFKLDEYTYQKGNTRLSPQYTNTVSLTNTYKYMLTTSLSYSYVKDIFAMLIDTAEKSKSFMTKQNLATQNIIALNISYPFMYKWYTMFANLNANYSMYKADLGGNGRTIDLQAKALMLYMQHSFKLGKGYSAEMSGWYSSPTIWQGTFETKGMGGVDMGMQKQVLGGKGNIKVSLTDVFKTMHWYGKSSFAGQVMQANGGWESQQFKVNFQYRFGKTTIKNARQRTTGDEDEKKRTSSSGGLGSN